MEHYTGDCSQNLANLAVASIGAAQDVAEATMGVALDILTAVGCKYFALNANLAFVFWFLDFVCGAGGAIFGGGHSI